MYFVPIFLYIKLTSNPLIATITMISTVQIRTCNVGELKSKL